MVMVTAMAMGTATATTEVMESRVVFKHCADALVRGLGPRLTPELKNKFIQLGIGADGMALPAIEYQRWNEILGTVAHDLMPELSAQDAYHRLGEILTDAYLENFIGRALKPVITLIGMKRALGRMKQNFRVANNYSEVELTELGPGDALLKVNEVGLMGYFYRGVLDRGLRLTSPKNLKVVVASQDADWVTFSIKWDA
jgi:uncharacterized protein (TIGR02265 family)